MRRQTAPTSRDFMTRGARQCRPGRGGGDPGTVVGTRQAAVGDRPVVSGEAAATWFCAGCQNNLDPPPPSGLGERYGRRVSRGPRIESCIRSRASARTANSLGRPAAAGRLLSPCQRGTNTRALPPQPGNLEPFAHGVDVRGMRIGIAPELPRHPNRFHRHPVGEFFEIGKKRQQRNTRASTLDMGPIERGASLDGRLIWRLEQPA